VIPACIVVQRSGHGGIYDLDFGEHFRGFSAGRNDDAVQPAILRAQRLASSLSVMPGPAEKRPRPTIVTASKPRSRR
jgi:hypothetical protein